MDFDYEAPSYVRAQQPEFFAEATLIKEKLAQYSIDDLMSLMHISRPLAEKVASMYQSAATKPALWAYRGDVFKGFQAETINQTAAEFAQDHLLIASAVYGVLRPYDNISPYRLEMNTKLTTGDSGSLYEFWKPKLARYISTRSSLEGGLCVLSSEEYAKAAIGGLSASIRIVTPAFIDRKPNGVDAQIPIYNKMMRGAMARWVVDRQIDSADRLHEFSGHGYHYNASMSTPDRPVFYRHEMRPLRFT
jgi:cytoplasmic iron level regulating protein YaaA (DUF328/UPF0246 family)